MKAAEVHRAELDHEDIPLDYCDPMWALHLGRARARFGAANLANSQADHHRGAGPAGPTVDMIARLVAFKLSEALGQTVIVDNRSGANGTIGSAIVAHAAPDGYTLLAATPASHVTVVHLMKDLPFDPVKDFTPIMAAAEPVTAPVVNAELPVNSVQELIAYAKANPGKLSYGSSGIGSVFHLTGELFNRMAGVNITHVPYRGVTQPMQDVAAGHIQ
jgi:tripartite-type tricarboxylate transporter receptor subunit TctC